MNTIKAFSIIALVWFLILLAGCLSNTPTLTARTTPTGYAYDFGPEFDCWRAPRVPPGPDSVQDLIFIVAFPPISPPPPAQNSLLSYDPGTLIYQVVIPSSNIELTINRNGDILISPSRNLIEYITGNNLNIYDILKDDWIMVPNISYQTYGILWRDSIWSPDGKCIFFDDRQGNLNAYRLSDGKFQKKPRPMPGRHSFAPYPTGNLWAWVDENGIAIMDLDGNRLVDPALEVNCYGSMPHWSPDGRYLAFTYASGCENLSIQPYIVRLVEFHQDGSISYENIITLSRVPDQIDWSNDSRFFLINSADGLYKYEVESQSITDLAHLLLSSYFPVGNFCISANGEKIYYIDNDASNGEAELYAFDLVTGKNIAYPLPEEYRTYELGPENDESPRPSFIGLYCAVKPTP